MDDRPKTSRVRTSLVDSEWEHPDGPAASRELEQASLDVPEEEAQTAVGNLDRLRHLTSLEEESDDDTNQTRRRRAHIQELSDASVDSLLESDEARNLPPPPILASPSRAVPSSGGRVRLPHPPRSADPPAPVAPPSFVGRSETAGIASAPSSVPATGPRLEPALGSSPRRQFLDPQQRELDQLLSVPPQEMAPATTQPLSAPPAISVLATPGNEPAPTIGSVPAHQASSMRNAASVAVGDELLPPRKAVDFAKLVIILGITLPSAVGVGIWLGAALFAKPMQAPSVAPSASVAATPTPADSEKPNLTLIERAAAGEFAAQDELKKKALSERTSDETLALARGRSVNKRLALEGYVAELAKTPELLSDKQQLQRLIEFLEDRETTNQTAAIVVNLPGTLGPDLLYDIWVRTRGRTETTILAEELLYNVDVLGKASEALRVALDLRAAEEKPCESYLEIIPRAAEHGDRRSLHLLGKLLQKRGCGDKKLDDCFACLRPLDTDSQKPGIVDAIRAVRTRSAPKF